MRTYFLITGAWFAAAALTAYVYARLAGFAAGSDAHLREPRPGRRQRTPFAVPGWVLAPLAMGCIASVLMADFALAPESTPTPIAAAPAQSVRMADPADRPEPRAATRRPRRSPKRSRPAAAPVQVAAAPATTPVAAAPRFVRTTVPARSAPPVRTRRPQPRDTAPAAPRPTPSKPKPAAPATPTAVAAAVPTPSPSPVPDEPAPAPAQPAAKPKGNGGPPPHAQANGHDEEKWTVHPPSKPVPGRVHRSKAPAGRPRCACR